MNKQTLIILVALSLVVRIGFAASYPLIGDELNFWNYFYDFPVFADFWKFFTVHDTQQPLFYLIWFVAFKSDYSQTFLRLPSILVGLGSLYYWAKLFPYKDPDNSTPWILFLFAPFLTAYTCFFLPYSLLVLFSLYSFYYYRKLEESFSKKNLLHFLLGCLLLTYTHYYGALLAVVLSFLLFLKQKNYKYKKEIIFLGAILVALVICTTDFLNDFNAVHIYRNKPTLFDLAGHVNLLIGGRYIAMILLAVLVVGRKKINFKEMPFVVCLVVFLIAYLKSMLLSPSLEARYLLILIYPIFYMSKGFQFKFSIPVMVATCLFSFYVLQKTYGPEFVTDYSKVPRTSNKTGLMTTICPKFYFKESNYVCRSNYEKPDEYTLDLNEAIVSEKLLPIFNKLEPTGQCVNLGNSLYNCKF
ncbi:hypothetical protein SHI21_02190 [Bacteriovorax sp. PP10]|uniref:Glycosyltransferase RgtA/B/C/D-like domain-containing protein n=1 Tax=Bacteriovorax antarcticus TaxID=3088717 RepID=A0ABU5VRK1_9BACT|nr:hypothetical protein [Bacteriovorax sp. PP10]MEA9354989.1 hypothetical protein [Bacteriovorax sp. PP10]